MARLLIVVDHRGNAHRAAPAEGQLGLLLQIQPVDAADTLQGQADPAALLNVQAVQGDVRHGQVHQAVGRDGQGSLALTAAPDLIGAAAPDGRVRLIQVDDRAAHRPRRPGAVPQRVLPVQQPPSLGAQGNIQPVHVLPDVRTGRIVTGGGLDAEFIGMVAQGLVPGLLGGISRRDVRGSLGGCLRGHCGGFLRGGVRGLLSRHLRGHSRVLRRWLRRCGQIRGRLHLRQGGSAQHAACQHQRDPTSDCHETSTSRQAGKPAAYFHVP